MVLHGQVTMYLDLYQLMIEYAQLVDPEYEKHINVLEL